MASSDLLDRIRGELDKRRHELRSAADEYERIEAAARALGDPSIAVPAVNGRARRGRPPKSSTPSRTRAQAPVSKRASGTRRPKGANQRAIVTVLRTKATPKSPLTAREVADATGLDPTIVHSALGRLTKQGVAQLVRLPASRRKFYALAEVGNSASA
jgi:hypothetical protein